MDTLQGTNQRPRCECHDCTQVRASQVQPTLEPMPSIALCGACGLSGAHICGGHKYMPGWAIQQSNAAAAQSTDWCSCEGNYPHRGHSNRP
jgi:hypothetical protein